MAEAVANAGAGTTGGADEALVRVLEDTALAKIMEKLEGPLQNIVHEAVHEAIVHATHASGAPINPAALAPSVPSRRQRAATKTAASRPKAGGLCDAVWKELDKHREKRGVPSLSDVQKLAKRKHWNPNNARVEYYNWRRANGISGRLPQAAQQAQAAAH